MAVLYLQELFVQGLESPELGFFQRSVDRAVDRRALSLGSAILITFFGFSVALGFATLDMLAM
jgi:hypothetical protein